MIQAEMDIFSIENNETLSLNYASRTAQVSYSISDFAGNVIMRGNYDGLQEKKLSISALPKGFYTLCIVDGDSLTKTRFHKDQ